MSEARAATEGGLPSPPFSLAALHVVQLASQLPPQGRKRNDMRQRMCKSAQRCVSCRSHHLLEHLCRQHAGVRVEAGAVIAREKRKPGEIVARAVSERVLRFGNRKRSVHAVMRDLSER